MWANWAWVFSRSGSGIFPVVRVVPLPASAMRNSTPSGISIRAVLGPGRRVADRLADRLDDAGHPHMTPPGFDIDVDLHRQEQGFQLVRAHRRKDPPYGGHIIGLAAGEDLQQGIALAF